MLSAYAFRRPTVALLLSLAAIAGCTQHGASVHGEDTEGIADDGVDPPAVARKGDEPRAEEGPHRITQQCTAADLQPRAIEADEGYDRATLRVKTADGLREIPLQETEFDTHVVGTVAETQVTQVFANPFDTPIEAVYAFPLHEHAAVDDYWIHVGKRSIHGIIKRRAEAKKEYEAAKKEGRTAGLLEQERPNVFTQSVANIMPGESIEVQMHVVQPLGQEDGRYSLVLPTVVGPRFVPGTPMSGRPSGTGRLPDTDKVPDASRISPPLLAAGATGCSPVRIAVDIESGFAASDIRSKRHAVDVNAANDISTVELRSGAAIPNRDFELSWAIVRESPEGALMVQADPDGDGGYFTLTIEPPDSLRPEGAVPRDLVFVVDNSGSMHGQPMEVAKQTVRHAVNTLNPEDTFQIMRFSEAASAMSSRPLANTAANRKRGISYIDGMAGMGGTMMIEGIKAAMSAPRDNTRLPIVFFLTDGYIGNETEIFAEVLKRRESARVFSVGVGSAPNRFLLDGLAKAGRGGAAYVSMSEDPEEAVDTFYARIASPALTDVQFNWGGLEVEDVVPSRVPDLFVGQPVVVYGRYRGTPEGNITVKGRLGDQDVSLPVSVDFAETEEQAGTGLASMWARTKIEELLRDPEVYALTEDEREQRVKASTKLALQYSVLTEKTAFIAVDTKVVVNPDGTRTTVAVPVELPDGMDGTAVGEAYGVGGLGLSGTGRGGGGTGNGTIGLGNTGLIGKGGGGAGGNGYGRGSGSGFGGRGKRVPRVRQAKATVKGALDKDIIRRIVRAHINEVRYCYEKGLAVDPSLKGRVSVTFTIGSDGKVTKAELASSTLPKSAASVGTCMEKAMQRWKFPKPKGGGVVVVTYPFALSPG